MLVCKSLRYHSVLSKVLETSGLQRQEHLLRDTSLAHILLYEHLFGKGIQGKGKLKVHC